MNDWDELREGACDGVYTGQFANTEGGHDRTQALDAAVGICCITLIVVRPMSQVVMQEDTPALSSLALPTHVNPHGAM